MKLKELAYIKIGLSLERKKANKYKEYKYNLNIPRYVDIF